MYKKCKLWIKQHLCDHTYNLDIQIRVIKCSKCGDKRWVDIKDIYKNLSHV